MLLQVIEIGLWSGSINLRGEVVFILSNMVICGSPSQARRLLIDHHVTLDIFVRALEVDSNSRKCVYPRKFITSSLEALERLLAID